MKASNCRTAVAEAVGEQGFALRLQKSATLQLESVIVLFAGVGVMCEFDVLTCLPTAAWLRIPVLAGHVALLE